MPSLTYFRKRRRPHWLLDIHDFTPDNQRWVIQEAERILKHDFTILNKRRQFGPKIDWSASFETNKSWLKGKYDYLNRIIYGFQNKYYIGDVKLPWEFNKHLHFIVLAEAYTQTRDEKFAREFCQEIEDWMRDNPYEENLAWTENLIVSHRAIAWVVALGVFIHSKAMTEQLWQKVFVSLGQHSEYIQTRYELAEKASNHLFSNLTAQIILCAIFPEMSHSKEKLKQARQILDQQLKKQVYPDGAQYEQSLSYHRAIVEFLLLILFIESKGDFKLLAESKKIIEKMLEFLMWMTQPNGFYQPISDADGARVFLLKNNTLDARPLLALGAIIFNRPDFKFTSGGDLSSVHYFITKNLWDKWQKLPSIPPQETAQAFEDGGYWVMRRDWSKDSPWLFFDAGPISMAYPAGTQIGTHGHSDTLNFGLALGKQTFITDLGSYSYTTERPYHQYFRSSAGHNVPLVDGEDENILEDFPWTLTQLANGQNQEYFSTPEVNYAAGEHYGYQRLDDPVICRREILFLKIKKMILVRDTFLAKNSHEITEQFHLHPDVAAKIKGKNINLNNKNQRLVIKPLYQSNSSLISGRQKPPDGWYALDYGRKTKATVVRLQTQIKGTQSLITLLDWGSSKMGLAEAETFFAQVLQRHAQPKIAMLVTNDLIHDPRVQKEAASAVKAGFKTRVFCFYLPTGDQLLSRQQNGYEIERLTFQNQFVWFEKLKNLAKRLMAKFPSPRLLKIIGLPRNFSPPLHSRPPSATPSLTLGRLFKLWQYYRQLHQRLSQKVSNFRPNIVHANDLDTLWAGYLIKKKTEAWLIYDAHEIWTEQGILMPASISWSAKLLERWLLTKIDFFITVNQTLEQEIKKLYPQKITCPTAIIHNYPHLVTPSRIFRDLKDFQGKKIILYQGRYTLDRGLEELILSAQYFKPKIVLILRGLGHDDIKKKLRDLVEVNNLQNRVFFLEPVRMHEMIEAAAGADIGIIAYRPTNLNNFSASPNKLYEYTMAGLALAVADLPELRHFVKKYQNGIVLKSIKPKAMAQSLNQLLNNPNLLKQMKKNSLLAAHDCRWAVGEKKLIQIYHQLIQNREINETL